MKIYIAGKITGDPNYKEKFATAQNALESQGYMVLNPAVFPEGLRAADYMRFSFAMIDSADIVAFLPDYKRSSGALLEYQYCLYTDKSIKMLTADEKPANCLLSDFLKSSWL